MTSSTTARICPADAAGIAEAIALLRKGDIAAIPTETVYGLAADAENEGAVSKIYAAKGRPSFNPLIVHVADRAMAGRYALFSPLAEAAAAAFWPGPLTLVLPSRDDCGLARSVMAGLSTVALRVPAHPVMQAVIAALGNGIAAPSANASGRLSPTHAAHVYASLPNIPLVLDDGPTAAGLESTIIAVSGHHLVMLRPGTVSLETIEQRLGTPVKMAADHSPVVAPGMLLHHYAPLLPLRLNATTASCSEFHLGFGKIAGDVSLSHSGNLAEAAAGLFAALHQAEASGRTAIAVAPIPHVAEGVAINDRLSRAARR